MIYDESDLVYTDYKYIQDTKTEHSENGRKAHEKYKKNISSQRFKSLITN